MMKKVLSATAIVLFSGAAAFAQTGNTTNDANSGMNSWDQTTRDAFFMNDTTLRSEAEMRTGWQSLDADRQAEVRIYCDTVVANTTGGTGVTQDADTNAPPRDVTGSIAAGGGTDMATAQELCTNVQSY